jgi:hypothetical protein
VGRTSRATKRARRKSSSIGFFKRSVNLDLDVGGQPEFRIRKADEDGGGTAFADYVWKPVVLVEMKKRGTDLQKHYRQTFDYWTRLVPNRPRYVVLCSFDEFRVYDFDTDLDTPKDTLALTDLPERWEPGWWLRCLPARPGPDTWRDVRAAVVVENPSGAGADDFLADGLDFFVKLFAACQAGDFAQ